MSGIQIPLYRKIKEIDRISEAQTDRRKVLPNWKKKRKIEMS